MGGDAPATRPAEPDTPPAAPTLEAQDARVVVGDAAMMVGLSLRTRGDRVLMVGSTEALVAAIGGISRFSVSDGADLAARITDGWLRVAGADVASGDHVARCGVAPLEPLVPPGWTVQEYLGWGARLGGAPRGDAKALVGRALERLGIGALRRRKLGGLARVDRRAVTLALAVVRDPAVILVDDPLANLTDDEVTALLTVQAAAAEGRSAIITVPHLAAHSPAAHLARTATDVLVFRGGELVLTAEPASLFGAATVYELTVQEGAEALRTALAKRGIDLRGGPEHFSVSLPGDQGPSDVLAAAAEVRAAVTTCVPLL